MYVCMYVCMYACMYVCMYACIIIILLFSVGNVSEIINITVKVIFHKKVFSCDIKKDTLLQQNVLKPVCDLFSRGKKVKITAHFHTQGALEVCNVEVYGRQRGCKYHWLYMVTEVQFSMLSVSFVVNIGKVFKKCYLTTKLSVWLDNNITTTNNNNNKNNN